MGAFRTHSADIQAVYKKEDHIEKPELDQL